MFHVFKLSPNVRVIDTGGALDVPAPVREKIDAIWQAERKIRGGDIFNGKIFNVIDISPDIIAGFYIDYAVSLAQYRDPALFQELNVRPLAVSGFVSMEHGIVFGLRNESLTADAGLWELVASGGVDDSVRLEDGTVDIRDQFLSELCEEINVPASAAGSLVPIALLEDSETHVCDIVIETRLSIGADMLFPLFSDCGRDEYIALDVIPEHDVKGFAQLMKGSVTPATLEILAHKGYIKLSGTPG